jgi:hypothetical protein
MGGILDNAIGNQHERSLHHLMILFGSVSIKVIVDVNVGYLPPIIEKVFLKAHVFVITELL